MPNGGYDYSKSDWNKIESFFEINSSTIAKFAEKHNLFVDKYYHDSPSWNLRFIHPKGGRASLDITYLFEEKIVSLSGVWYIDIYDEFTRYIRRGVATKIPEHNINIEKELLRLLKDILSWGKNQMKAYHGYENPWKNYSKKEFESMEDKRIKEIINIEYL